MVYVKPGQKIAHYDHLLTLSEVESALPEYSHINIGLPRVFVKWCISPHPCRDRPKPTTLL